MSNPTTHRPLLFLLTTVVTHHTQLLFPLTTVVTPPHRLLLLILTTIVTLPHTDYCRSYYLQKPHCNPTSDTHSRLTPITQSDPTHTNYCYFYYTPYRNPTVILPVPHSRLTPITQSDPTHTNYCYSYYTELINPTTAMKAVTATGHHHCNRKMYRTW